MVRAAVTGAATKAIDAFTEACTGDFRNADPNLPFAVWRLCFMVWGVGMSQYKVY